MPLTHQPGGTFTVSGLRSLRSWHMSMLMAGLRTEQPPLFESDHDTTAADTLSELEAACAMLGETDPRAEATVDRGDEAVVKHFGKVVAAVEQAGALRQQLHGDGQDEMTRLVAEPTGACEVMVGTLPGGILCGVDTVAAAAPIVAAIVMLGHPAVCIAPPGATTERYSIGRASGVSACSSIDRSHSTASSSVNLHNVPQQHRSLAGWSGAWQSSRTGRLSCRAPALVLERVATPEAGARNRGLHRGGMGNGGQGCGAIGWSRELQLQAGSRCGGRRGPTLLVTTPHRLQVWEQWFEQHTNLTVLSYHKPGRRKWTTGLGVGGVGVCVCGVHGMNSQSQEEAGTGSVTPCCTCRLPVNNRVVAQVLSAHVVLTTYGVVAAREVTIGTAGGVGGLTDEGRVGGNRASMGGTWLRASRRGCTEDVLDAQVMSCLHQISWYRIST